MTDAQARLIRDLEEETAKYQEQQKPDVKIEFLKLNGQYTPIIRIENDI